MKVNAVVIDSNVWISALVFGGNPRKVLERLVSTGASILLSHEITLEVRRILNNKFPDFIDDFEALLTALSQRIIYVTLGTQQVRACRDADDNRVLETAIIGRATVLISGDKDLLILGEFRSIKILTPADAIDCISNH